MHFSFFEKFGLSVLVVAWLLYGVNFLGDTLISVRDFTPAFKVAEATAPAGAPAAAPEVDFATLLATVTPAQGEKVFNKCKACHSIEQGGPNKVGPNMWNVVGGPKAHVQGFAYSAALAEMGAQGQTWGYDELNAFLIKPSTYVKGTKMTFAGLSDPEDRAAVIIYMRANTPSPPPLPTPAPKPEQTAAAAPDVAADAPLAAAATAAAATAAPAVPAAAGAPPADLKTLLASADPAAGEKVFNKCKACHKVEQGGANMVGPNLWNVVGGPIAEHAGFNYSAALAAKKGGTWTYEELDTYLTSPKAFAPGTKMTFAGLAKPEERANVIAFLRTKSDNPPPLP